MEEGRCEAGFEGKSETSGEKRIPGCVWDGRSESGGNLQVSFAAT